MKKILCVLLFGLACFFIYEEKFPKVDLDTNIENIAEDTKPFLEYITDQVLLSVDEIEIYNQQIFSKTNSLYHLDPIYTKDEIITYITRYLPPKLPKYNGNEEVTNDEITSMLQNRNIEHIKDEVLNQKGIVIHRTNLKSFPTTTHFFEDQNVYDFDQLQETEVSVATPVLILHESLDQKWVFIVMNTYVGWIQKEDVAYAEDDIYNYFYDPSHFGVITDPMIEVEDTLLDMGVRLPYLGVVENGYQFAFPIKKEDGFVQIKKILLGKNQVHIGYLPYTKKNIIVQAFKYEGFPYHWGGMDDGVDCSSYISNIYRTFGFVFPRNTSDQKESVGNIISLEGFSYLEKEQEIEKYVPSLLYMPGHVMIYLGNDLIIHASGTQLKVTINKLSDSHYLDRINRLILVE